MFAGEAQAIGQDGTTLSYNTKRREKRRETKKRAGKKRTANDGKMYTLDEYVKFYGTDNGKQMWKKAGRPEVVQSDMDQSCTAKAKPQSQGQPKADRKPAAKSPPEEPDPAHWTCPACTLSKGKCFTLNSAPYPFNQLEKCNQCTDHFAGKKHEKAMKNVGRRILSSESMTEFFTYIGRPLPDFTHISPIDALKQYIKDCGGDPERAIVHFAAPPPPVPQAERRSTTKCVLRGIASPTYATAWKQDGVVQTQLLCCWDDPTQASECKRENCPYRHASQWLAEHPEVEVDPFELVPCTFAGMDGGCKWHKNRLRSGPQKWVVPPFELKVTSNESTSESAESAGPKPIVDGKERLLQLAMQAATGRYLAGIDTDDESGDELRIFSHDAIINVVSNKSRNNIVGLL